MCKGTESSIVAVRILLADGSETVREELRRILSKTPQWQVCGEASTGEQAVELALRLHPNVAVIELALPGMNGLEVTRRIKAALPETEILVFTTHELDDLMRDILAAGARGYLLKSEAAEHITAAIDALSQHWPYLTENATRRVLDRYLRRGVDK